MPAICRAQSWYHGNLLTDAMMDTSCSDTARLLVRLSVARSSSAVGRSRCLRHIGPPALPGSAMLVADCLGDVARGDLYVPSGSEQQSDCC